MESVFTELWTLVSEVSAGDAVLGTLMCGQAWNLTECKSGYNAENTY
jgi:hypothetical protein